MTALLSSAGSQDRSEEAFDAHPKATQTWKCREAREGFLGWGSTGRDAHLVSWCLVGTTGWVGVGSFLKEITGHLAISHWIFKSL